MDHFHFYPPHCSTTYQASDINYVANFDLALGYSLENYMVTKRNSSFKSDRTMQVGDMKTGFVYEGRAF